MSNRGHYDDADRIDALERLLRSGSGDGWRDISIAPSDTRRSVWVHAGDHGDFQDLKAAGSTLRIALDRMMDDELRKARRITASTPATPSGKPSNAPGPR